MKKWEECLLDKNIPNPIPPPPYVDLDERFNFVDREEEEKEILRYIEKAKVNKKGFLLFLLADQGRGKTSFLKNLIKKYSYPSSKVIFSYMKFPSEVNELNFSYIYRSYLASLFHSGIINEIHKKLLKEIKDITGEEINDFKDIERISNTLTFKTKIFHPFISTLILYSLPPSIYSLEVFKFIEGDELMIQEPKMKYLFTKNNHYAITRIKNFSEFVKHHINIEHNVLIIDDFDVVDRDEKTFRSLYKFLINFRNNSYLIENFSIILSGSTTFYDEFINFLSPNERQRIESWIYFKDLDYLKTKHFIEIVNSSFSEFWKAYIDDAPFPENIFGVFSREAIEFLYEYEDKNLRNTLRKLHDIINKMKDKGEIEYYTDIDKIIREFKVNKLGLKEVEREYFIKKIENRVKKEKSSTFVNKSLKEFILSLKKDFKENGIYIEVENEKRVKNYFADIYLSINKLNPPMTHNVIFEVKLEDNPVSYKDIKTRVDMLREEENSYLYWITKSKLSDVVFPQDIQFRILREDPLNLTEYAYLSYITSIISNKLFDLENLSFKDKITLLKQAGIDFDIIVNPPKSKGPIPNLDLFIVHLLEKYSKKQKRVMKKTIIRHIKEIKKFENLSEDFILDRISEIAGEMNFKITSAYITFKKRSI